MFMYVHEKFNDPNIFCTWNRIIAGQLIFFSISQGELPCIACIPNSEVARTIASALLVEDHKHPSINVM